MGKCATGKKAVRGFAYGGNANDIAGDLAGTNIYANGAGTTTGLSGAVHMSSTDASTVDPAQQQAIGQLATPSAVKPGMQSRRDASPLARLDQEIAMGNAMGELSNTERYQLANPGNKPYTVGAPQGGRRGNPSVSVGVSPGSSAAASQEAQRIGIMQSLRNNLADQPLYAGFSNGGIIGKLKESITGEKEPPPKSTTIGIRGRSDDMQVPAFANGGSVRQAPTQSPNANWGKRPQMDEATTRIVNAAGNVVDHPAYAAAQFIPATSIPLGGIAAGVHALQGRTDELPIDAAAMIPAAKGVMLAKGAKLAAQNVIGATGRVANGVQALSSVDAFGSPAYANGGKIKGPGTPTSDSIQAKITDTGEPIAVSTGERIVSKAQDVYLQKVASGLGFDSLDAMLEAGTGKPVGPTIKGGMKHAFNGALLEKPRDPVVVPGKWINNGDFLDKAPMAGPVAGQIPPQAKIDAMQAQQVEAGKQNAVAPTPVKPTPPQGATPAELIAAQPTAAAPQESKPDQEIAKGGSITFGGKTVSLPEAAPVARDPNRQYDAHGNDMTYTNQMKAQLAEMQRERLMRDMGADITSQGTRVAAAQQLAQMDKNRALDVAEGRSAAEERLKGQQIAQLEQENTLRTGVVSGDEKAVAAWNRLHPQKGEYIKVSDGEYVDESGNVLRRPDRIVNIANSQALGGNAQHSAPKEIVSGMTVNAPDGTHTYKGKTISVKDGKVTGVK